MRARPTLSATGGGEVRMEKVPTDQTAMAVNFFSSERVPAALIAGATLGVLFAFSLVPGENLKVGLAKRVYITLVCSAFCNSLFSVSVSSLAIVKLMTESHDPMAMDPVQMLVREFPLYFLAVRAHFLTGLICFAGALSIRMWAEYSAGCPRFSRGMVAMVAATMCFMVAVTNQSLKHFDNVGGMWLSYLKHLGKGLKISKKNLLRPPPVALVGVVCLVVAAVDTLIPLKHIFMGAFFGSTTCPMTAAAAFAARA